MSQARDEKGTWSRDPYVEVKDWSTTWSTGTYKEGSPGVSDAFVSLSRLFPPSTVLGHTVPGSVLEEDSPFANPFSGTKHCF